MVLLILHLFSCFFFTFSFQVIWPSGLCLSKKRRILQDDHGMFVQAYNRYSHDLEMVSAILCAGLYPNVVQCKRRGKRTAFYTKEVGKVDIHPGSVNAGVHLFPLPYIVYSEKVKTASIYIRDSTIISDYSLLLFGGNLIPTKTGEGIEMLGGYLHFSASKSVLELIRVTVLGISY